MSGKSKIEQVKIYGERNTGTTFLRDLINRNFITTMLRGGGGGDLRANRGQVSKALKGKDWLIKAIVLDRVETIANRQEMEATLGWKHMSPPIEWLQRVPDTTAKTLFVVNVKHPVFWALSFHRRPYHSFFRKTEMTFSEFVRNIYIPGGRDNVDAPMYDSAVGLYAAKIDGYRRLAALDVPFALVRYEDLLCDVPAFLARLETDHGLVRRSKGDVIRDDSTKGEDKTFADYRDKYRLDGVRNAVSAEDYEFIMENFGRDRLAWLGYPAEAA
jgi:hypothetical protein